MMNLGELTEKRNRKGTVYYENEKGEVVAKRCTNPKCGETKSVEEFDKQKLGLGGLKSKCKKCIYEMSCNYRKNNQEKLAEYSRNWARNNPEKKKINDRNWMRNNLEYYRNYRKNNQEKIRNYRKNNQEKIAEAMRNWRKNNPEYNHNWRRNNPDKTRMNNQRRRARKKGLPDTLTTEKYKETLSYFGNACALTGQTLNLEKEHAIPISIGHGGTTFENCYPMTSGLNYSKFNHNIFEWFEANRQRFELSQERFDRLIEWLASANAMTVEEYRDYVYWCHDNPRTIDEINEENESEAI